MSTIITSIVTGGSSSHATVAEEANAFATDFINQGVQGTITNTGGIAPCTGSFGVSQDASPDMGLLINAGIAYIKATPASQDSQILRARMNANATAYTINSNSTGSTVYDWIYLSVNATNANNPDSAADNVTSLLTSRSTSNTADNGSPPTYGILLAIVTVTNGASSIVNANIADGRTQASLSAPASLVQYNSDNSFDHVTSGCVWTGDSYGATLNGSMSSGVVYIGGNRIVVGSIAAHAFTASKDTYIYVDNTGTVSYNPQTNNAASPSLPSNSLLLAIVVSGSSNIADAAHINQGQPTAIVPIASSIAYTTTDSNGNLICPRDAQRRVLGYRQVIANQTGTTIVDLTGLSVPVIVPANRRVKIKLFADSMLGTQLSTGTLYIFEGSTQLVEADAAIGANTYNVFLAPEYVTTPSVGLHTYKGRVAVTTGTFTFNAGSTAPAFIMVELV